jgi:hypothetical protein
MFDRKELLLYILDFAQILLHGPVADQLNIVAANDPFQSVAE